MFGAMVGSLVLPLRLRLVVTLLLSVTASACAHAGTRAPYSFGQGPTPAQLLARAAPQIPAIAVPQARIVVNRTVRGNLAFVAQSPSRFRGSIEVSGNELVTLAMTEHGYALRYKLDAFEPGFYAGPPNPCAAQALLGVPLRAEDLVAMVLGGGPTLSAPYQVIEHGWVRKGGYERVVIANSTTVEALDFRLIGGTWYLIGGTFWQRQPNQQPGQPLWSFGHEDMAAAGGTMLPGRTKIVSPGHRRDTSLVVTYKTRVFDPPFAQAGTEPRDSSDDRAALPPHRDDQPGHRTDDDDVWADDGNWENDPVGETGGAAQTDPEATTPSQSATYKPMSPVFRLDGAGLPDRGDLCRPTGR